MAASFSGIDQAYIDAATAALHSDARFKVALNAVTRNNPNEILVDHAIETRVPDAFSIQLDSENKVANQGASGRCWLFAFLNVIRRELIKKHGFSNDFELSQTHLFFWDKIERCNFFLETIIETVAEPRDGRLVHHILGDTLMNDGGQWDMCAALIKKYGIVPKSVRPDTWTSGNSARLNSILTERLRGGAAEMHAIADAHAGTSFAERAARGDAMRAAKDKLMVEIWRIVCIHLGEPVFKFDWQYAKKDKTGFTRHENLTPVAFARDICGVDPDAYVSIVHDPRHPVGALLTVEHLGNVWGASAVRYINAPIEALKAAVKAQLEADHAVWFGCDVGKEFYRKESILDPALFQYELVLGSKPTMDKRTRLLYGHSLMTHAMVFTAVDVRGPRGFNFFRVENSWKPSTDATRGTDGYLAMSDAWFSEYVFQVLVPVAMLDESLRGALTQEPLRLPAWDPMGSLARPFDPSEFAATE